MICTWNWDAIASFANAMAVIAAAFMAQRAFNSWRHEWIARRESEASEDALALAYEGDAVFRSIRSPMQRLSIEEDGKLGKDAGVKNYAERLNRHQPYFEKLFSALPRTRAILGDKVYEHLRKFGEARIDVTVSLEMYIEHLRDVEDGHKPSPEELAMLKEHKRNLWRSHSPSDPLWATLITATTELEKELLPKIRLSKKSRPNPHPSSAPQ